jgi:hypothetical protein
VLGTEYRWKGYGLKRSYQSVDETIMYVPLSQTLRVLLGNSAVYKEVIKDNDMRKSLPFYVRIGI